MIGVADREILLEIDARLLEVVAAHDVGRLRDQREGQIIDRLGVRKAAVLPLDQRQQPLYVAARALVPRAVDELVHRVEELAQLPGPAVGRIEHDRLHAALEVGAVLGADDVAVAVPGGVYGGAGLLLEGLDDRFRQLAHQLVLHADHVPVVDLDAAQVGFGLRVDEVGRERRGDAERAKRRGHAQEVAAAVRSGELSSHDLASPMIAAFAPVSTTARSALGKAAAALPPADLALGCDLLGAAFASAYMRPIVPRSPPATAQSGRCRSVPSCLRAARGRASSRTTSDPPDRKGDHAETASGRRQAARATGAGGPDRDAPAIVGRDGQVGDDCASGARPAPSGADAGGAWPRRSRRRSIRRARSTLAVAARRACGDYCGQPCRAGVARARAAAPADGSGARGDARHDLCARAARGRARLAAHLGGAAGLRRPRRGRNLYLSAPLLRRSIRPAPSLPPRPAASAR